MFYCSQQGHYIAYTLHITFKICNARRKFYTFLKLHLVRDISRSSRQDPQCILCIIVSTRQRVMCKKSKLTISECSYYLKTIMNLKGGKWTKQRPKLMYAKEDGWTGNVCMKIHVYNNLSIFYCHIFQPGMCVYVTDCTFVCKKKKCALLYKNFECLCNVDVLLHSFSCIRNTQKTPKHLFLDKYVITNQTMLHKL